MTLLAQLQMFFEQALRRTAEKAGAKVRSKSLNNSVVRESLDGISNADVIRTLGPAIPARRILESATAAGAAALGSGWHHQSDVKTKGCYS